MKKTNKITVKEGIKMCGKHKKVYKHREMWVEMMLGRIFALTFILCLILALLMFVKFTLRYIFL